MVARIKDKGLEELGSFKRRVLRQASMEKVRRADSNWLVEHVEEIERFIHRMSEKPDKESEMW